MNGQLREIFTTFRAYPNGAHNLERAIERAFHQCTLAVQQFDERHGIMITPYNPGLWVDKTEEKIRYKLSMPQTDIARGMCTCTVGNSFARIMFGGGLTPTARPILTEDNVKAIVICTNKYESFTPSFETLLTKQVKTIGAPIYVKEYTSSTHWLLDGIQARQKYSMSNRTQR